MSPCLDCEYGERPIMGPLDAFTNTDDIAITCRCPHKINGRCSCRLYLDMHKAGAVQ